MAVGPLPPPPPQKLPPPPNLTDDEASRLKKFQDEYDELLRPSSLSVGAASFLLVGALIVIGGACSCLTLPGVNVMHDVILKGVFPGAAAILISLPCIVAGTLYNRDKNVVREKILTQMNTSLQTHDVIHLQQNEKYNQKVDFILINFLNWYRDDPNDADTEWNKNTDSLEYQRALIRDLKKKVEKGLPKEQLRNKPQKDLLASMDDVINTRVYAKRKPPKT